MARPLTELDFDRIDEYELRMDYAESAENKQDLKQIKRLFLLYLKRRKLTLKDIGDHSICQYYANRQKPIRSSYVEIKRAKVKKHDMRDYRKRMYVVEKVKKEYGIKYAKMVNDYLSKKRKYTKKYELYVKYGLAEKEIKEYLSTYYLYIELDKFDSKEIEKTISVYETEYNDRIKKRNRELNRQRLFYIRRIKEDCGEDPTETINDYFNNDLDDIGDIVEDLIVYDAEYDKLMKCFSKKQLYIIDRMNEHYNKDCIKMMMDFFSNKLKTSKTRMETIKKQVASFEKEYNKKSRT